MLALVAATALALVHPPNPQDETRLALTQSIATRGTITIDAYDDVFDRAEYGGHSYTDKPPGVSLLALVPYALVRGVDRVAGTGERRVWHGRWHRWLFRALTTGPLFLVAVFLVGRAAEALVAGTGAFTAVGLGLGTLFQPLAPTLFGHVGAGACGVAAFLLAWHARSSRASAAGGVVAGLGVLFEYQTALAAAAIAAYVVLVRRRESLPFLAGLVPPALALALYNLAAFGSPFRLSYRYVANEFADEQRAGFFGIGMPDASGMRATLVGESGFEVGRGLLVTSPLLAFAVAGLVLMARGGFVGEAAVCLSVTGAYLVYNAGYFEPYGGTSPGPRFFAAALPFVALGVPIALRAWRATVVVLALSVFVMTLNSLAWALNDQLRLTVLPETVWSAVGAPRAVGVAIVFVTAVASLVAAFSSSRAAARPCAP